MKVIFLDFDGVLNSYNYFPSTNADEGSIDPRAVKRLNKIIELTGAVVCLSTSWRLAHSIEELTKFLVERGFVGRIVGVTPTYGNKAVNFWRGDEVNAWLETHRSKGNKVESFVVLDDIDEFPMMQHRHVMTNYMSGLMDSDIDKAVRILQTLCEEDEMSLRKTSGA